MLAQIAFGSTLPMLAALDSRRETGVPTNALGARPARSATAPTAPESTESRSAPAFRSKRSVGMIRSREAPKRLTRLGRKTRLAFPLSQLRPTSPDFANGRGRGANRPFPAADLRDSPSFQRGAGADPGPPPPIPRLWAPILRPRPLPVSRFRHGPRKPGSSGAGWTLESTRGGPIFVVADHTSDLRPLAH
jgi:hypothetical protein